MIRLMSQTWIIKERGKKGNESTISSEPSNCFGETSNCIHHAFPLAEGNFILLNLAARKTEPAAI